MSLSDNSIAFRPGLPLRYLPPQPISQPHPRENSRHVTANHPEADAPERGPPVRCVRAVGSVHLGSGFGFHPPCRFAFRRLTRHRQSRRPVFAPPDGLRPTCRAASGQPDAGPRDRMAWFSRPDGQKQDRMSHFRPPNAIRRPRSPRFDRPKPPLQPNSQRPQRRNPHQPNNLATPDPSPETLSPIPHLPSPKTYALPPPPQHHACRHPHAESRARCL